MDSRKWLFAEIGEWVSKGIIDEAAGESIRALYPRRERQNILLLFFSIIGSLLIGGGIILICARNWYELPVGLRVGIAFLPLLAAQALAAFAAIKKREHPAFCEGAGIFLTLSVFSSVALIGQIFHLPSDFGAYMLTCALLSLPVSYLLPGVGPLMIYGAAITVWCGSQSGEWLSFWALALFALALPKLIAIWRRGLFSGASQLLLWFFCILGFASLCFIMQAANDSSLFSIAVAAYISLMYLADAALFKGAPPALRPLGALGFAGIMVFLFFFSNLWAWDKPSIKFTADVLYSMALPLLLILGALYMLWRSDRRPLSSILGVCAIFTALLGALSGNMPEFLPALIINLLILALGISFIVRGAKTLRIGQANLGMSAVLLLIIFRFFDWDFDFLSRGIAFVVLGAAFLTVNLILVKKRKAGDLA